MDIYNYEKSEHFDRNEAIYILHKVDKLAHEEIATRFQLTAEEIKNILSQHEKYELAVVGAVD